MVKIALINIIKDMECPPLTLVYLATYIQKHHKAEVKIIDINFEEPLEEIKKFAPDIIGISSHTIRFNYAKKLANQLKKITNAKIIIGGVHISTHPTSFSKEFDIAVIREGEKTLSEIIDLIEKNKFNTQNLKKVKGIMFWKDNKIIKTKPKEFLENLDEIPIPNRSFVNKKYFEPKISYNKIKGERVIEAGIMTSRGCPYNCSFCSANAFWTKIRFHSPKYVAKEIKYLVDNFNVNYIVIYDDFFAISQKRLNDVREELRKNNTLGKVKFSCSARANVITDDLCKAMKKLGVITVNFGFESGSNKILRKLKGENVTVEQNINATKKCIEHGLNVTGSFIVGSPEEKIKDMEQTLEVIKTLKKLGATELWCGVAVPYPKTKLWEYAVKNNLLKDFKWELANPSYIHNPVFLDKSINKKDFFKIFKEIKNESLDIALDKQSKFSRKIKEKIYYNKNLYSLSEKILQVLPKKIKAKLLSIFKVKGIMSTK